MAHQVALTIRAKIKPGQMGQLRKELDIVNRNIGNNALVPFARLGGVHFARFVILEEAADLSGKRIGATLVFASNVDAPVRGYFEELLQVATEGLDRIYANCEGYPAPDARTRASRLAYLMSHRIKTQAFYVNTVGRTVEQVRLEAQLRDSIEEFLERQQQQDAGTLATLTAAGAGEVIQDYVRGEPSLKWSLRRAQGLSLWWRAKEALRFVLIVILLLVLSPLFLLLLPFWLVLLRYHEKRDARADFRLSLMQRGEFEDFEDQVVQNQFSAVGHIKPGWFRYLTVRVLLAGLAFAVRHLYNRGDLGTVKPLGLVGVNTIHFAQWIMIDEGRRMLFLSNYDGSLVSYMDDFVNKVAWGLNAVFSNGHSYPKTDWLFLHGAHDEQGFKAFLQQHQIPTQAWYTAYKQYTALNLTNNAELRDGLFANLSERQRAAWLQRL